MFLLLLGMPLKNHHHVKQKTQKKQNMKVYLNDDEEDGLECYNSDVSFVTTAVSLINDQLFLEWPLGKDDFYDWIDDIKVDRNSVRINSAGGITLSTTISAKELLTFERQWNKVNIGDQKWTINCEY